MIKNVYLLHALSKDTYLELCDMYHFNADDSVRKANIRNLDGRITQVHLYNTVYKDGSQTWCLKTNMDFESFDCTYEEFPVMLYQEYQNVFGGIFDNPAYGYDKSSCYYIEYAGIVEVDNADKELRLLERGKCVPEQLDKDLWDKYYIQKGSVGLYLCRQDETHIETVIRCHGAALKRRYGANYARNIGVVPEIVINRETEKDIIERTYRFYKINMLNSLY